MQLPTFSKFPGGISTEATLGMGGNTMEMLKARQHPSDLRMTLPCLAVKMKTMLLGEKSANPRKAPEEEGM